MTILLSLWMLLMISLSIPSTTANTQMPKVFVETKVVELIDPLKAGFHIVLDRDFITHYLDPGRMPTVFLSAIPLPSGLPAKRLMYYGEDLRNEHILLLSGLEEQTWYVVCVEFENVIRKENRGNTSTTCQLIRTLDVFGKAGQSLLSDVLVSSIGDTFMEFRIGLDSDSRVQLTAYLESGSCPVQSYIVARSQTLRVHFADLSPGFNYGRLCVLYQPLITSYTMMGRSVQINKQECYFEALETKSQSPLYQQHTRRFADDGGNGDWDAADSDASYKVHSMMLSDQPGSRNGAARSAGAPSTTGITTEPLFVYRLVMGCVVACVLSNVLMPVVPLAYLVLFSPTSRDTAEADYSKNERESKTAFKSESGASQGHCSPSQPPPTAPAASDVSSQLAVQNNPTGEMVRDRKRTAFTLLKKRRHLQSTKEPGQVISQYVSPNTCFSSKSWFSTKSGEGRHRATVL